MDPPISIKRLRQHERPEKSKKHSDNFQAAERDRPGLLCLPVEILIEILLYVDQRDLYSLRRVDRRFEQLEPAVWRVYEVKEHGPMTPEVIHQLKRMPHLQRLTIDSRTDCDQILRQVGLTNGKLRKLRINNCSGTTAHLYLRSCHLTRVLERCPQLHTVSIAGSRLRGQKFYRLLGRRGLKLRSLSCEATGAQCRAFAGSLPFLGDDDRATLYDLCVGRLWSPLRYFLATYVGRTVAKRRHTAIVSYADSEFLSIGVSE